MTEQRTGDPLPEAQDIAVESDKRQLRKVTFEFRDDGRVKVVRERSETGETYIADDLYEAFDFVIAAYRPDGTPRPWPKEAA